jgi:hypothetical protein
VGISGSDDAREVDMAGGEMPREGTPVHARGVTLVAAASTILGKPLHVQEDEQVLVPFTSHNDVVVVPGRNARDLVSRLERAGVDGDRISFVRLDHASLDGGDATPSPRLDAPPIGRRAERSVVASVLVCGIIGAAIVALVVWAFADASAAAWGALGGFALGGALGALWGVFGRLGASPAWERSLHLEGDGQAAVGVHLDDPHGDERVVEILRPYGLWQFAHDGSVVRRPDGSAASEDQREVHRDR